MTLTDLTARDIYRTLKDSPEMVSHVPSLGVHAKRYERLVSAVGGLVNEIQKRNRPVTILDVGPWWQTELFRRLPDVHVNTMGLLEKPPPIDKPRSGELYFQQDLNRAVYEDYRADIPQHDLVIMAEVIEHLPVAPTHILRKVRKVLKPGGFLILSTPNAVSLGKRIKMLKGQCPYTVISEDPNYPSHFRECTLPELLKYADSCGFSCTRYDITNDWNWRNNPSLDGEMGGVNIRRAVADRVQQFLDSASPSTWRQSILMVLTH
jgi:SAM-dependent methyltransferase